MPTMENSQTPNREGPVPAIPDLPLLEVAGEPRAYDLDIANRLRFARPRKIRDLIKAHMVELEAFGVCPAVGQTSGVRGGRPATEYFLNEEQALLIASISDAPEAPAVRAMLIRVFVAWRRGHIGGAGVMFDGTVTDLTPEVERTIGGIVKRVLARQLNETVPGLVAQSMLEGGHVVSTEFKPALEILKDCKVPSRKRRAFSQRVSSKLRRYSTEEHLPLRLSRETGRYLFHVEAIAKWLIAEGNGMIRDHMAALGGQGVLKLVPPPKVDNAK